MRPGCSRAAPEAARLGPPEAAGAGDADGGTTAARPAARTTTMTAAAGRASIPGRLPSRAFRVFRAFNRDAMVPLSSSETHRALPPKDPGARNPARSASAEQPDKDMRSSAARVAPDPPAIQDAGETFGVGDTGAG